MEATETRRMLELAAKAIGLKCISYVEEHCEYGSGLLYVANGKLHTWAPHLDDGDSRRLEVALGIQVTPYPIYSEPKHSVLARKCRLWKEDNGIGEPCTGSIEWIELYGSDPYAATRLAVLRAAEAIGEAMP